ncbi:MAG TPA: hypothetical protein VL426_07880 [Candidatus Binatia bacterium]|nr:hypothetical protein [Candidatus Binatia bacterium]
MQVVHWTLVCAHLALIGWYFLVKYRVGRSPPATIRAMCAPGFYLALAHAVAVAFGAEPRLGQAILAFAIDAGLMMLFRSRWNEAKEEATP